MTTSTRISIGHVPVDALTRAQALARIVELARGAGGTVFTPNVDHVMRAERDLSFRDAYQRASLSLVDGMPVLWASRWLRMPLPEKVSGSDLIEPLFALAEREDLPLYLLGGRVGSAERVLRRRASDWPRLRIVGCSDPTRVLERDLDASLAEVERELERLRPKIVVVALSSPHQELFATRAAARLPGMVFVALGSAIDLLAGQVARAPKWMCDHGLEWAYRLSREPTRLARRYLIQDPPFFLLVARQAFARRKLE